MKVYVAVGTNGILRGLIMGVASTKEKAEEFLKLNEWQIEPSPKPAINELIIDGWDEKGYKLKEGNQ